MTKSQKKALVEQALKKHGGSQAEFGRDLGISRQYVNDMLKGRKMSELWVFKFKEFLANFSETNASAA